MTLLILFSGRELCVPVSWAANSVDSTQTISVCGSTIDISLKGDTQDISRDVLVNWVKRAATAVCTYYGKYPVPHVALKVHVHGGPGVHNGVTYPAGTGGLIRISVGAATTLAQFDSDWTLTHEMIHLTFPSMAENHHWIEEGIAVYVEPIARVQAGQLSAKQMWADLLRDMPQGEPQAGDQGLDRTHTWARTYWGGAMFCLLADVQIREQTDNRKGLQDALRGILNAGGVITQDWSIERALAVGDKATGTTVLTDLYSQMRDKPIPVDLAALWQRLGIQRKSDAPVDLISSAPLADIREAITRPQKMATANPGITRVVSRIVAAVRSGWAADSGVSGDTKTCPGWALLARPRVVGRAAFRSARAAPTACPPVARRGRSRPTERSLRSTTTSPNPIGALRLPPLGTGRSWT
jgi:hypothetical protein